MFLVWMIEYSGFILLALAFIGIISLIVKAKAKVIKEEREEQRKVAEAAYNARKKQQEAARKQAETEAAALAKKEADAKRKAAREEASAKVKAEKQAEREAARKAREEASAARMAAKLEAARLLAEYRERALAAARELKELETPRRDPEPEPVPEASAPISLKAFAASAPELSAPDPDNAPKPFQGHMVSFTGKLKSMTRGEAAEMVRKAGGKAFTKAMPAGTTLLIVGDTAGCDTAKLEKADEWIGQLKKLTEGQFLAMLKGA